MVYISKATHNAGQYGARTEVRGIASSSTVCFPLKHDKQLLLQSSSAAYTSLGRQLSENCEGTKALSACLCGIKVTF